MSLRDTILQSKPLKAIKVEDWGETIYIKKISGVAMLGFQKSLSDVGDDDLAQFGILIDLIIITARDEHGELIFTESDKESLLEQPFYTIQNLSSEIMGAVGIGGDTKIKAKKK